MNALTDRELALIELAYGRGRRDMANRLLSAVEASATVRADWLRGALQQYHGLPRMMWTGEYVEGSGGYSKRVIGDAVLATEEANAACADFEDWRSQRRER